MTSSPTTAARPPAVRTLTLDASTAALLGAVRADGGEDAVAALRAAIARRSPRLTATVLSVYAVPAGGGVSYGHTFIAEADTRAADVAIGYGHGLPRHAGNRATMTALVPDARGQEATPVTFPIIGRVAMDDAVVRIDDAPVRAGDTLTVFGDRPGEPTLDEWCALIDEDPVSVLSALDDRVTWVVGDAPDGEATPPVTPYSTTTADPRPRALIDLGALTRNLRRLQSRVAPAGLLAVVKDDGYAHGLERVTRHLVTEGVEWFGALDPVLGREIRLLAPEARIFVWHLPHDSDLAASILDDLDIGVTDVETLERVIQAVPEGRAARIHLQVDTGLHRGGTPLAQWEHLLARVLHHRAAGALSVEGVFTHLAEASEADDSRAIAEFHRAADRADALLGARPRRHLAASAAAFERADARADMVRIGAFLYGIAPGGGVGPGHLGLDPVMTVEAPVVEIVDGGAWIGIGGRDGLLRTAAGSGTVALGGERCRIVEVTPLRTRVVCDSALTLGQTATLWGAGVAGETTLQEWADALATIGEELVTRLTARVTRLEVGG